MVVRARERCPLPLTLPPVAGEGTDPPPRHLHLTWQRSRADPESVGTGELTLRMWENQPCPLLSHARGELARTTPWEEDRGDGGLTNTTTNTICDLLGHRNRGRRRAEWSPRHRASNQTSRKSPSEGPLSVAKQRPCTRTMILCDECLHVKMYGQWGLLCEERISIYLCVCIYIIYIRSIVVI